MTAQNVEAILPLGSLQKALLFHSLQAEKDQGFLQVKCTLNGELNIEKFRSAWEAVVQTHEVLRASIHWEKVKKPVMVIHREASVDVLVHDLTSHDCSHHAPSIRTILTKDAEENLTFTKAPVFRVALIKLSNDEHVLVWSCHHILLDGWSASIVIQDLFDVYDALVSGDEHIRPPLPSLSSFNSWLCKLDTGTAKAHWQEVFQDYRSPQLSFASAKSLVQKSDSIERTLSKEDTGKLQAYAKQKHITANTLLIGIWGLVWSRFHVSHDTLIGATVSGRNPAFPKSDEMVGMFMNVLPVRVKTDDDSSIDEWLQSLLRQQQKSREYEHIATDQIAEWTDWPVGSPMMTCLIVFENFPWQDMKKGGLTVSRFSSGITSTFPVTLAVIPGEELKISLTYSEDLVSVDQAQSLVDTLSDLCLTISDMPTATAARVGRLKHSLGTVLSLQQQNRQLKAEQSAKSYTPPSSKLELDLVKIWEQLFDIRPIGIHDDFFELGGKSLSAVQLFARIEHELGHNLQPTSILQYSTIHQLAGQIDAGSSQHTWDNMIPLKATGSKAPLFCLHAGLGHVFFYKPLAETISGDRPLYAIEPIGLDGQSEIPDSVEEIAKKYLDNMLKVCPDGPIHVLGYCQSIVIAFEVAKQVQEMGKEMGLLAMIDTGPTFFWIDYKDPKKREKKTREKLLEFILNPKLERISRLVRKKLGPAEVPKKMTKQEVTLVQIQEALNEVSKRYQWSPYQGKLTFIRTEHRATYRSDEPKRWELLVDGELDVHVIKADHIALFEEPDVTELAHKLNECLSKSG